MIRNCDYCNESYVAKRATSRFCSTNCRVGFNRLPEKMQGLRIASLSSWRNMQEMIDRYPHLATSFVDELVTFSGELKSIRDEVLLKHPIQRRLPNA